MVWGIQLYAGPAQAGGRPVGGDGHRCAGLSRASGRGRSAREIALERLVAVADPPLVALACRDRIMRRARSGLRRRPAATGWTATRPARAGASSPTSSGAI